MNTPTSVSGMSMSQLASLVSFLIGFVTIWVHLEISIAEINVEITNLKQDLLMHKTDNRKDIETLRNDNNNNNAFVVQLSASAAASK